MTRPTAPHPDAVPVPRLEVRNRKVGGVLMLAVGEHQFELSETAAFIWRHADGDRTVGGLAELLAAEYGIELDHALADVGELLQFFAENRLLYFAEPR
jgi:Coenzyme PQQ synthesis protein D (PqqD)